eukprot:5722879-Amphidinium_carterae.3
MTCPSLASTAPMPQGDASMQPEGAEEGRSSSNAAQRSAVKGRHANNNDVNEEILPVMDLSSFLESTFCPRMSTSNRRNSDTPSALI